MSIKKQVEKKMCCVMGCPSDASKKEVLYAFPASTTQRYRRWLTLFPNSFLLDANKSNFICRRHFTPESFDEQSRLRHSSDPTINIDTSYAQDTILKAFLAKVIYEWCVRNDIYDDNQIASKALEVKEMLGLPNFKADRAWLNKFNILRDSNVRNGKRFGSKETQPMPIFDIIKDLRQCLPSNFALPVDLMNVTAEVQVKNECDIDGDDDDNTSLKSNQLVNLATEHKQTVETAPPPPPQQAALDTYQDALEWLKPLEAYIIRIGNKNALIRLQEVVSVVKQVIESENLPRKGVKRCRS